MPDVTNLEHRLNTDRTIKPEGKLKSAAKQFVGASLRTTGFALNFVTGYSIGKEFLGNSVGLDTLTYGVGIVAGTGAVGIGRYAQNSESSISPGSEISAGLILGFAAAGIEEYMWRT